MSKKIRSYNDLSNKAWEALCNKATAIGHKHGSNAAEWIIQDSWGGRVSRPGQADQAARAFLKMWDEGDTGTLDYPRPPDLSGEMADAWTPASLYDFLDLPENFEDSPDMELCKCYEDGSSEGFWDTLTKSARAHLKLDNPRRAHRSGALSGNTPVLLRDAGIEVTYEAGVRYPPKVDGVDVSEWFFAAFDRNPRHDQSYFLEWVTRWTRGPRDFMDLSNQRLFDRMSGRR